MMRIACLGLLLLPLRCLAQADAIGPVVPEQSGAALPAVVAASPAATVPPAGAGTAATAAPAPVLQTAASDFQASVPAGVCPVITDYLYQQCEQNPQDSMCAPASGN